jgi:hypothetical protein
MQFLHYAPFFCLFAGDAFGGSLIIINNYNQCMVWSDSNYGCIGYSAPFAVLEYAGFGRPLEYTRQKNAFLRMGW